MKNRQRLAAWFSDYRDSSSHYADLAERTGADALAIGTELGGTTTREREWRAVIAEIPPALPGPGLLPPTGPRISQTNSGTRSLDRRAGLLPVSKDRAPTTEQLVRAGADRLPT